MGSACCRAAARFVSYLDGIARHGSWGRSRPWGRLLSPAFVVGGVASGPRKLAHDGRHHRQVFLMLSGDAGFVDRPLTVRPVAGKLASET